MVDRVDRRAVKDQMEQRGDQQDGEGPVQRRVLQSGGKVDEGHKGQHQKQSDLHSQRLVHPFTNTIPDVGSEG